MFDTKKYNPKELTYILSPKNEEEMIAISRAIKVIEALRQENTDLTKDYELKLDSIASAYHGEQKHGYKLETATLRPPKTL
jgi:hypothetical protein